MTEIEDRDSIIVTSRDNLQPEEALTSSPASYRIVSSTENSALFLHPLTYLVLVSTKLHWDPRSRGSMSVDLWSFHDRRSLPPYISGACRLLSWPFYVRTHAWFTLPLAFG